VSTETAGGKLGDLTGPVYLTDDRDADYCTVCAVRGIYEEADHHRPLAKIVGEMVAQAMRKLNCWVTFPVDMREGQLPMQVQCIAVNSDGTRPITVRAWVDGRRVVGPGLSYRGKGTSR
jgi:hypothetical protein